MPHPNPRILIPIVLLTVLGVGGWYVEQQRAETRSTLSGFFETQPAELASRITGRVAEIRVREGDTVRAGQPLIVLEADTTRADTAAKRAQERQARAQYEEMKNGPRPEDFRRQEAVVAELSASLARLRNGPLPEEIAAARAKLHEADALYRKTAAGSRPQEIAQARAAEQNARAKQQEIERGLTDEDKAQYQARLNSAMAQENLAHAEVVRIDDLYKQGAVSKQQYDRTHADELTAAAKRQEMDQAYRRALEGNRTEQVEQAREAYRQAKAALDLVLAGSRKEDIQAARSERAAAQQNLNLLLRGSREEDIRAAEARLAQAQAQLDELRAGNRKEQVAQAKAAEAAATASANSMNANLEERILRAPKDGVVDRVLVAVGDLLSPGTPTIRMTDPNDLWIRVYVAESKLAKVKVGDSAELRIDGIPEPTAALVESIATKGEFTPANLQTVDERGKQVFAVRLRLKQPDPRVKAGMYASAVRIGQLP